MVKINDKSFDKEIEVIEVAIGKKTYEVPLAKYLPYKQLKKLKDKHDLDAIIEVLGKYIPVEILEDLNIQQLTSIVEAWGDASNDSKNDDDDLGK